METCRPECADAPNCRDGLRRPLRYAKNATKCSGFPLGSEKCNVLVTLRQAQSHPDPDELVFHTATGEPLNRHNLLRRHLRPACQKLGLNGIHWHSLRHAHATFLDAAGAPLGTVQALLGHASSETTREIYLHAIPDDQRKAVANVEALVFGLKRTQVAGTSQSEA